MLPDECLVFDWYISFIVINMEEENLWTKDVFEKLFMVAVDYESTEMLEELLHLAYGTDSDGDRSGNPFVSLHPHPNSKVLAMTCKKNNYSLVRLMVDRGYRLKPFKVRNLGNEEKTTKARMKQWLMQFSLQRRENKVDESFEESDQIQSLRLMELAVNPSYILACYISLAERCDLKKPIHCECSKKRPNLYQYHLTENNIASNYLSNIAFEEDFHYCPSHTRFKPSVLCDQHLECNDPVTRYFLLAKICSDFAEDYATYRADYRYAYVNLR